MRLGKSIQKINEVRIGTEVLPFINRNLFSHTTEIIMDIINDNVNFRINAIR